MKSSMPKTHRKLILLAVATLIGTASTISLTPAFGAEQDSGAKTEPSQGKTAADDTSAGTNTAVADEKAEDASGGKKKKLHPAEAKKKKKDDGGGYYGTINRGYKPEGFTPSTSREGGYYHSIQERPEVPYAEIPKEEPKPEVKAPAPQPAPAPVVAPRTFTGPERKFKDDPGATGSITLTRHLNKAKEFAAGGHWDFARKHYKEVLNCAPDNYEYYPGYYEACVKCNDWSEAATTLEKLIKVSPENEKLYSAKYGQALFELRKYSQAQAVMKKALGYGKDKEIIHRTLLRIAKIQGNSPAMVTELNELLKVVPNDGELHVEYGNLLLTLDRKDEALSQYRLASKLLPTRDDLHARLGYMLMYHTQDYAGAVAEYTKAIQCGGNKPDYEKGYKYAMQQQQIAEKNKAKERK